MSRLNKYIDNLPSLEGRRIVVTGANSGIGFALSKLVVLKKGHLFLACRNLKKAEECKNELLKINSNAEVDILIYDQSSLSSCEDFAKDISQIDFDSLVLNAGVFFTSNQDKTKDDLPLVTGVNFFGNLKIISSLNNYLNGGDKKNIIVQSSVEARRNRNLKFDELLSCSKNKIEFYSRSKNAVSNMANYYGLNRSNKNLNFILTEPGISGTNIIRHFKWKWFKKISAFFMNLFFQKPEYACLDAAYPIFYECENLSYFRPKNFFSLKGFPKKVDMPKKFHNFEVIKESLKYINGK